MSKTLSFTVEGRLAWTVILILIPVYVVSCVCLAREIEPFASCLGVGFTVGTFGLMMVLAANRLGGNTVQRTIDRISTILFTLIFFIPAFVVYYYCWVRGKEPPHIVHIAVGFVLFSIVLAGTLSALFS